MSKFNLTLKESLRVHAMEFDRLNYGRLYTDGRLLREKLNLIEEIGEMIENGTSFSEAFNTCFDGEWANFLNRAIQKFGHLQEN